MWGIYTPQKSNPLSLVAWKEGWISEVWICHVDASQNWDNFFWVSWHVWLGFVRNVKDELEMLTKDLKSCLMTHKSILIMALADQSLVLILPMLYMGDLCIQTDIIDVIWGFATFMFLQAKWSNYSNQPHTWSSTEFSPEQTSTNDLQHVTLYDGCHDVSMDENYLVAEVLTTVSHVYLRSSLKALSDEWTLFRQVNESSICVLCDTTDTYLERTDG